MKLPTQKEIYALLRELKPTICDDYRASDDPDDDMPGMQITIGCDTETGAWSFQTGDNSYTGGTYGYATWGIGYLYRNSNCRDVARSILSDLAENAPYED